MPTPEPMRADRATVFQCLKNSDAGSLVRLRALTASTRVAEDGLRWRSKICSITDASAREPIPMATSGRPS